MFKGSITALVTPFSKGEIDKVALKNLVDWQITEGSNGLVPVGTTGESPTLSHEEHESVVESVVKAAAGKQYYGDNKIYAPCRSSRSKCRISCNTIL